MRNLITFLTAMFIFIANTGATAFASEKNGLYLGAQAGWSHLRTDLKPSVNVKIDGLPDVFATGKASVSKSGVHGELFGGYTFFISAFFISPEISVGLDGVNGKKGGIRLFNSSDGTVLENHQNEVQRLGYGNLAVQFGKLLSDSIKAYLRLGLSLGRFEYKFFQPFERGTTFSVSDKKWLVGFNPGAGFEFKLIEDKSLYLRGEYNFYYYENYKTKAKSFSRPALGGFIINTEFQGRSRPEYHSVSLGLVYRL